MAHRDPARLPLLRTLRDRYPLRADEPSRIGDVMRTGEPQLIESTDAWLQQIAENDEHLGLLRELAMGSVISVPMTAAAKIVGALVFVNEIGSRSFDAHDLEIAAEVARRAAIAIENARIADERARMADALQRELLPPSLPRMPGWEIATMYEPAGEINEVGGDFYEAFPVEGGWAVLLGDVSGKGAAAAAVTAEARHTIRTAGTLAADPVAGLHLLDEALRGRDDVALCSVALVVLPDSPAAQVEAFVYLAGHPHPILLRNGGAEAVGEPGPLLGVVEDPTWIPTPVTLELGDQLVLYTDGVIEARGEGNDRFGSDRLRARLAGCQAPELAVERVRGALSEFGARARGRRRGSRGDPPRRPRRRAVAAARGGRAAGDVGSLMDLGAATDRRPLLFLVGGVAAGVISIALAAVAGGPYLALDSLSPWIVTFAIGLFCALFATPFVIYGRLGGELEADARWERAVLWWALVAVGVLVVAALSAGRAGTTPTRWAVRSRSWLAPRPCSYWRRSSSG